MTFNYTKLWDFFKIYIIKNIKLFLRHDDLNFHASQLFTV